MSPKITILFCAQLLLVKNVFTQYMGPTPGELANMGLPEGYNLGGLPAAITTNLAGLPNGIVPERFSNGGSFRVQSSSPIALTGISVLAENLLVDGTLAVSGSLPFLGAVSVDGALPAGGQGAVAYNCGNGNVGIVKEGVPEPIPVGPTYGPGMNKMSGLSANSRLGLGKL